MEKVNSSIAGFVVQGWEKRIPITQALWEKSATVLARLGVYGLMYSEVADTRLRRKVARYLISIFVAIF